MTRPIPTPDQIEAFDHAELFAASMDFDRADPGPEPGPNHSDAYWWGWWCRKNPTPDDTDPRAVEIYWAMRRFIREKRPGMVRAASTGEPT